MVGWLDGWMVGWLDGCWMVGESGIKANSAQISWSLAELGNMNSIVVQVTVIRPSATITNLGARENDGNKSITAHVAHVDLDPESEAVQNEVNS